MRTGSIPEQLPQPSICTSATDDQDLREPPAQWRHAQPLQLRLQECGQEGAAGHKGVENGGEGSGWRPQTHPPGTERSDRIASQVAAANKKY